MSVTADIIIEEAGRYGVSGAGEGAGVTLLF